MEEPLSQELFERVRNMCADVFQVPPAQLRPESSPVNLEAWDSVQHLNLVLALEQEFGVPFDPEDMDQMKSVGAIAALVGRKLSS